MEVGMERIIKHRSQKHGRVTGLFGKLISSVG